MQIGAIINLLMYWGLGLPFSCILAFKYGLGAMGLWTGLACTASLQSVYLSYIVFRWGSWLPPQPATHYLCAAVLGC